MEERGQIRTLTSALSAATKWLTKSSQRQSTGTTTVIAEMELAAVGVLDHLSNKGNQPRKTKEREDHAQTTRSTQTIYQALQAVDP